MIWGKILSLGVKFRSEGFDLFLKVSKLGIFLIKLLFCGSQSESILVNGDLGLNGWVISPVGIEQFVLFLLCLNLVVFFVYFYEEMLFLSDFFVELAL